MYAMKKRPSKSLHAKLEKARQAPRARRKIVPISHEMRHWCAMLEAELRSWPAIKAKSMFGFVSFYRSSRIFAAIPRSCGFGSPSSLLLKFDPMPPEHFRRAQNDSRLDTSTRILGEGWFAFEFTCDADLQDAL
jgi:hypothetical protein